MALIISLSGIRGIVGQTLDDSAVEAFAAALGRHTQGGRIVLSRDTRPSGHHFNEVAIRGLCSAGCEVVDLGIAATPTAAFMVHKLSADAGLMITASHNPAQWNGLKFFSSEGAALQEEQARQIWQLRDTIQADARTLQCPGHVTHDSSANHKHVQRVLETVDVPLIARQKFKVVLDSINGAGGASARMLLESLGCELIHLNDAPDGQFAHLPEPTENNLRSLCDAVKQHGPDVGFAQDPDADRLAIVDERGTYIGEEYTIVLAAQNMLSCHPGPIAVNLSTSRMIDALSESMGPGCVVHRTPVGEANVVRAMQDHQCIVGGEGNGGVIDPRITWVRDSLTAMANVLNLLASAGARVSELVERLPRLYMIKQKFEYPSPQIPELVQALQKAFSQEKTDVQDGIRIDWSDGWVHVRGSNTEPIVRIISEASDPEISAQLQQRVWNIAKAYLG